MRSSGRFTEMPIDKGFLLNLFAEEEAKEEMRADACKEPPRDMVSQALHAGVAAGIRWAAKQISNPDPRIYPCAKCGALSSIAEGGRVFSLCEECLKSEYGMV